MENNKAAKMQSALNHFNDILAENAEGVTCRYMVMTPSELCKISDFTISFNRLAVNEEYIVFEKEGKVLYYILVSGDNVLTALSEAMNFASFKF